MVTEFLKKAVKPIATAAVVLLGVGVTAWFADPRNDIPFNPFTEPLCGPWNNPDRMKNTESKELVTLHADELRQLRWMSTSQLKAIFNGRRGQFRIESSPAAYQELRWMSTSQIEAIFGTKDIPTA